MSDTVELQLNECACTKAVDGDSFPRGLQQYPFSVGRPSAWIPSQSYFRFRLSLRKKTGNNAGAHKPPSYLVDKVAMAENVCACLYSNAAFRAGGQDVSSILSYIPQAAQAKMRLNKSLGWQKSVGNGCYMVESSFNERSKKVSSGPYGLDNPDDYIVIGTGNATVAADHETGIITVVHGDVVAAGVKPGDILVLNGKPYEIDVITNATTFTLVGGATAANGLGAAVTATTNFSILRSPKGEDEGLNTIFVLWQPPISIFDHAGALGAGDYTFSLMPNVDYMKAGIESKGEITIGSATDNFQLVVEDVKFYAATVKMEIPSQVQTLKMLECQIDSKAASSNTTGTYQFQVPPSTVAISVWLQANEAGSDTRYSPTVFRTTNKSEKQMSAIQITYSNVSKPNTKWSAEYADNRGTPANLTNLLQQRYYDTYRECDLLETPGGIETFDDFLKRGMVVHYSFLRDSEDKATNLQLSTTCGVLPGNTRVFVCAWFNRVINITTENGSVVEVRGLSV